MILDDTIVAVSSPPGSAPRGIVRLSGPEAIALAGRFFDSSLADTVGEETRTSVCEAAAKRQASVGTGLAGGEARGAPIRVVGRCRIGPAELPAAAYVFRAPRSYTRQDLVEIHLLGAPGVLALLVESLLEAGARRAEAGEFTARAFLGGALDLGQVHGVAAMINAATDRQLAAAERLLHGALSRTALAAREELADLLSLVEGALDFADEPIEFITPVELRRRLEGVADSLRRTADAGLAAERWGRPPHVVLVGRPNAGKSSLLNRLSGVDRAIDSPTAGTTRDVLTAPLRAGDFECVLVDAAGLGEAVDELDEKAQAAAIRAVDEADLLLHVVDVNDVFDSGASRSANGGGPQAARLNDVVQSERTGIDACGVLGEFERAFDRLRKLKSPRNDRPTVLVLNKVDCVEPADRAALCQLETNAPAGYRTARLVSAVTGEGCDELIRTAAAALADRTSDAYEDAVALLAEQREALLAAVAAVDRALDMAGRDADGLTDADLVALELHAAADALGVLVGQDLPDDLLGRIFSRFCIGK